MTQAEYLIQRFGGINPMARALGLTASVVQGWKERGTVPGKRLPMIFGAGQDLCPRLEHREFLETLEGVPHALNAPASSVEAA